MIDAHAHLTDALFAADRDEAIARAAAGGVTAVLTCGEDLASSAAAVELARRSPTVRAAVGIHPHRAADCDLRALERLRALVAGGPEVVAIGEIGIDLSGRSAARPEQERAFAAQVALASEVGLPASIHVRDAGAVVRTILEGSPRIRGHVHCYSEGPEEVELWLALGLSISFAGTVTYPRNEALRRAAAIVPDDRLLVETDAPYLAPTRRRGRRNEPAFVAETYARIAEVREVAVEDLARSVSRNADELFGSRWHARLTEPAV